MCGKQVSLRYGSWFNSSRLTIEEIFLLTFEIVIGTRTWEIKEQYFFGNSTLSDWRQFINERILEYVEENSEKIGGVGKIVEVDESKFGKRKYNRGHRVEGQWVFGGVERGSGRTFLVAVHDRKAETLVSCIKQWIEPGTIIYSDYWKAYDSLGEEGYEHLKANHSLHFLQPANLANGIPAIHTNTVESLWNIVKNTLPIYNWQGDFKFYLAMFLFERSCRDKKVHVFNKFLEIIRDIPWEEYSIKVSDK
ncbi:putative transposase-like protein like [Argiope bruennichi]|uniref:Putative transposase-like protein like n=1 Tax=Argiope bruennichi TaxID=94029 RepID=A0A8T0EST6_ARGBR|nr:putative transposase-like protein like [Argiope bruennichi]